MKILEIMKVPYYKKGKVINKNKSLNVEIPVNNEETYFLGTLPEVEITTSASPETIRKGWELLTNEWALQNPTAIFKPKYRKQRAVLTDDTWRAIIKANNITDPADKRFKMIPTKFLEQAMQGRVRKAINEDGVKLAGLAAAVPGAIIGGGALAKPVLSQMIYHPGTFLAETVGGTIGGYVGGTATDAITKGVSDYDSFADMITSNSTIPEQYAEMLNPGMLLGGLAGGIGGNVLYNNVVKPAALRVALPYLMAKLLNKNVRNTNLGTTVFDDAVLLGKVGWGPKLNVVFKHGSENPNLQTFIPYETWDVEYRGASPYKYFVTEHGSPHNMMDERPFLYIGLFDLEKPIVLIGEFDTGAKNVTRNQLVQEARNRGADSYYMKGIYDNKADDQNVIIKFIDNEGETPYMGLASKSSTLTEAERLGIPKGERNLPYVEGYRKRHPEDIVVNVEKEKKQIIDLFNKPIYRDRLLADGYTELEIDDFVKNQILFLDRLKKAPAAISKNVPSDANGIALVDHIRLHHYDPEVALHEFGHLSEYPTFYRDLSLPKITKTTLFFNDPYYRDPSEVRTRALGVLLWLDQNNTTVDDFYRILSNKELSDKLGKTLNKRALEFLLAYPEDQGRNYLAHFRQQGGIINYLNPFNPFNKYK